MVLTDAIIRRIMQPGLWFVKTRQSRIDISKYIYELAYKGGVMVNVFSSFEKVIQNNVISMIERECLAGASDEMERNWLEREMEEYDAHGFFGYPPYMNDYLDNGIFWRDYAIICEHEWFIYRYCVHSVILVDGLEKWRGVSESDMYRIFRKESAEAKANKKSVIVFVDGSLSKAVESFIDNHLLY